MDMLNVDYLMLVSRVLTASRAPGIVYASRIFILQIFIPAKRNHVIINKINE